jgi:3'-5' exoribonuclease
VGQTIGQWAGTITVTHIERKVGRNGVPFASLDFRSSETPLTRGFIWNLGDHTELPKPGEIWGVGGDIDEHQGRQSLHIELGVCKPLGTCEAFAAQASYHNTLSPVQLDNLYSYFLSTLGGLSDPWLRVIVSETVARAAQKAGQYGLGDGAIVSATGSVANHHCYRGGFLDHTCEMLRIANAVLDAGVYPDLNRDAVNGGILVHDIGKLLTYGPGATPQNSYTRTFLDAALGHIALGYECFVLAERDAQRMAVERLGPASGLDHGAYPGSPSQGLVEHVKHIILSHHGTREWGSPASPCTPEAQFVHLVDMMSAGTAFAVLSARSSPFISDKFDDFRLAVGDAPSHNMKLGGHAKHFSHDHFTRLAVSRR